MFYCTGGSDIRQRKIMDHLLSADSFNHSIWLKWQHGAQDFGLSKKLYRANIVIMTYGMCKRITYGMFGFFQRSLFNVFWLVHWFHTPSKMQWGAVVAWWDSRLGKYWLNPNTTIESVGLRQTLTMDAQGALPGKYITNCIRGGLL